MNRKFRTLTLTLTLCALAACSSAAQQAGKRSVADVDSFKSCAAAGYTILKSYPPRCVGRDGKIFTDEVVRTIDGRACKDNCGNGQCEQIVCEATGCPCAETPVNCARDCAENSF